MKLIIDIPEDEYKAFQKSWRAIEDCDYGIAYAIKNGIPLDKIRAEIDEKYEKYKYLFDTDFMGTKDIEWVLSVIDKYMERSEE